MTYTNLCYFCQFIGKLFNTDYGSQLEEYITSHYPKSVYDVEKLTREYESRITNFKDF